MMMMYDELAPKNHIKMHIHICDLITDMLWFQDYMYTHVMISLYKHTKIVHEFTFVEGGSNRNHVGIIYHVWTESIQKQTTY